jgi:hypothetical protein
VYKLHFEHVYIGMLIDIVNLKLATCNLLFLAQWVLAEEGWRRPQGIPNTLTLFCSEQDYQWQWSTCWMQSCTAPWICNWFLCPFGPTY